MDHINIQQLELRFGRSHLVNSERASVDTECKFIDDNPLPQKPAEYQKVLHSISRTFAKGDALKTPIKDIRLTVKYGRVLKENYYHGSLINNAVKVLTQGMSSEAKSFVNSTLRKCHIHLVEYWEDFIERLTLLTLNLKQWQTDFSEFWYLLVDFQLIAGYQVDKVKLTAESIYDWLHDTHDHGVDYDDLFSNGVDDIMSRIPTLVPDKTYSVDEFISTPALWASAGASMRSERLPQINHNKWTLAYLTPLSTLRDYLTKPMVSYAEVFVKPDEPLKNRNIANSDDNVNLQMCYILHFVDHAIHHCGLIANYLNNMSWLTVFRNLSLLKSAGLYSVDIDQTDFDHQPTKSMVMLAIKAICARAVYISQFTQHASDLQQVVRALLINMEQLYVKTEYGTFLWNNGIISGWRWTSLLGSIINWAEGYVIDRDMEKDGYDITCQLRIVQGDDISEIYNSENTAYDRVQYWTKRGFVIHQRKTIIDRPYGEFLRYIYRLGDIRGYPARMLHSVFTVAVGTTESENVYDEASKRGKVLASIQSRKRTPFCDDEVERRYLAFFHAPTVYGGCAISPIQVPEMVYLAPVTKTKRFRQLYSFQSERIGYTKKVKVRRRKFQKLIGSISSTTLTRTLFDTNTVHFNMFYEKPDDMYFTMEDYKGKAMIDTLIAKLTPQSRYRFEAFQPYLTRKMQFLLLQNRLPQPTYCGEYNQKMVSMCSDDLTGRLLNIIMRHKLKVGVGRWSAIVSSVSIDMPKMLRLSAISNMTE